MTIKQKMMGLLLSSLIAMGAAGPLAAMADGSQPVVAPTNQAAIVQNMSATLAGIVGQVQLMATTRTQETKLFGDFLAQLHTMQVELQQGSATPTDLGVMSATLNSMSAQLSQISQRRAQENQVLSLLPPLLDQLLTWLRSLGA